MAWYSSNYQNRQLITIAGTADGAQTNYQLKLTVYKAAGSSSGAVVYLNTHCKDDFSDIFFTKSDGTSPLDYWVESYVSGTSAVVWIEFDSIPISPNTANFYIYYNYSSATSASSGTNTFKFFDDFSGDLRKWTQGTAGDFTVSGGHALVTSGRTNSPWMEATGFTTATNQCVEVDVLWDSGTYFNAMVAVHYSAVFSNGYEWFTHNGTAFDLTRDTFTHIATVAKTFSKDTVYHIRFFYKTNYQKADVDGGSVLTGANTSYTTGKLAIGEYIGTSEPMWFDNVFVRNWTTNEPTWGTWGAEETYYIAKPSYYPHILAH